MGVGLQAQNERGRRALMIGDQDKRGRGQFPRKPTPAGSKAVARWANAGGGDRFRSAVRVPGD